MALASTTVEGELGIGLWSSGGQSVGASLLDERGLTALESVALGFFDGEINFADGPVAEDAPLLGCDQAPDYLARAADVHGGGRAAAGASRGVV